MPCIFLSQISIICGNVIVKEPQQLNGNTHNLYCRFELLYNLANFKCYYDNNRAYFLIESERKLFSDQ